MAILIEAYSVVIRRSTLVAKIAEGVAAYQQLCPNNTFCMDANLTRVAFMAENDATNFAMGLARLGIMPFKSGVSEDVAIISEASGFAFPCNWVVLGDHEYGKVAWLAGTEIGNTEYPPNWKPDSRPKFVSPDEARQRLEFLESEGNVDIYRDKTTGERFYVGRTSQLTDQMTARHNELYEKACQLTQGRLMLSDRMPGQLNKSERSNLDGAISLLGEVVSINPANWAAMWILGKCYQRLGDPQSSLGWFDRSHCVNPDQVDVAREASIAAMDAGLPEKAVEYSRRAIEIQPGDGGLLANLALALLFSGKPADAHQAIKSALELNPTDDISARVSQAIDAVIAGEFTCPKTMQEMSNIANQLQRRPWWKFWT